MVTVASNGINISRILINPTAKLNVGATTGHNLGDISGQGTLTVGSATLPSGAYNLFTDLTGGTIEYNGSGHALPATRPVYNHLIINSAGTITNANALLTVNGNLMVNAGTFNNNTDRKVIVLGHFSNSGTYVAGTAASTENLELSQDFINNGTFTPGTANVLFNGTTDQRIRGTSQTTFGNLQVSKASGYLKSKTQFTVTNQLMLDQGILRLDSANAIIGASAILKPDVITSNSYVWASQLGQLIRKIGSLPMQAANNGTLLPVGDSSRYLPFSFTLKTGTLAAGAQVAMNMTMAPHPQRGVAARYLNYYWHLDQTGISGTVNYDARYWVNNRNDLHITYASDPRAIRAAKYSAGAWLAGGTYDTTQRVFDWTNIASFSDFTGGTGLGDVAPLPVSLMSFTARTHTGQGIQLNWATATESQNAGFWVERSADGKDWSSLAWVPATGSGSSSQKQAYAFLDKQPIPGQNLYRLRQEDRSGLFAYSSVADADWQQAVWSAPRITLSPNPGEAGKVNLRTYGFGNGSATYTILDSKGLVLSRTALTLNVEESTELKATRSLPPGLYQVILEGEGTRCATRMIIQ